MKKVLCVFLIFLLLGCNTAEKALEKGNYDLAIKKAVKNLRKDATSANDLYVLDEAFNKAKKADKDRIAHIESNNNPEDASELYELYSRLKNRQHTVSTSPALPNGIVFENYDDKIIQARGNAVEYHYTKGNQLFLCESHYDARDAYVEFQKVKQYDASFEGIDQKIEEAKDKGTSYVLIEVTNNDMFTNLPARFIEEIKSPMINNSNSYWVKYIYTLDEKDNYYTLRANITEIEMTPERTRERNFRETKDIKDGKEFLKDENGRFVKDSLGNKIEVDKYKTIYCDVREETRSKQAGIKGVFEYHQNGVEQPIKKIDFIVRGRFQQVISYPNGDINALSDATKQNVGVRVLPFPTDDELLLLAADELEEKIITVISENKILIK